MVIGVPRQGGPAKPARAPGSARTACLGALVWRPGATPTVWSKDRFGRHTTSTGRGRGYGVAEVRNAAPSRQPVRIISYHWSRR